MKRIIVLLLIALFSITLSGCGETPPIDETVNNYYVLPDLNGKTKDEIIDILERNNQAYIITEFEQELELYEL